MQTGGIKTYPEKLNLYEVIDKVCVLLENMRTGKNIGLEIQVGKTEFIYGDKYMLSSVFNNLLSNAIKFTPNAGQIKIYSEPVDNRKIKVSISDTGIGMTEENLK